MPFLCFTCGFPGTRSGSSLTEACGFFSRDEGLILSKLLFGCRRCEDCLGALVHFDFGTGADVPCCPLPPAYVTISLGWCAATCFCVRSSLLSSRPPRRPWPYPRPFFSLFFLVDVICDRNFLQNTPIPDVDASRSYFLAIWYLFLFSRLGPGPPVSPGILGMILHAGAGASPRCFSQSFSSLLRVLLSHRSQRPGARGSPFPTPRCFAFRFFSS